jgi:hypothetical protein
MMNSELRAGKTGLTEAPQLLGAPTCLVEFHFAGEDGSTVKADQNTYLNCQRQRQRQEIQAVLREIVNCQNARARGRVFEIDPSA